MCGRFALSAKTSDIEKLVNKNPIKLNISPRYNIAPTQSVLAITSKDPDNFTFTRWGLIPYWAKDMTIGSSLINARAETLEEKPSFRNSFKKKRCLIFADGYYEWKALKGSKIKVPYFVSNNGGQPFAFAALWDSWKNPEGEIIESATIITTSPKSKLSEIHHRMPVMLDKNNYDLWLDVKSDNSKEIKELLNSTKAEDFDYYEVSTLVNSPSNDVEECKRPA